MLIKMLKTQFWTRFSLESDCVFYIFQMFLVFMKKWNGYRVYIATS
jgi:hypothetical protein